MQLVERSPSSSPRRHFRLRLSWKILVISYAGLSSASWGILSKGADLSTANGRHLLAGALANLAVVAMGIIVSVVGFRRGERWAWFACAISLLYGMPMIIVDSYYLGFWTWTVIPQVLGLTLFLVGLLLPADIIWRRRGESD